MAASTWWANQPAAQPKAPPIHNEPVGQTNQVVALPDPGTAGISGREFDAAQNFSALEVGVRKGLFRNPQPMALAGPGAPVNDTPDSKILDRPPGSNRAARHPVMTLLGFRRFDGAGTESYGLHTELKPGAAIPPQSMQPQGEVRKNSFRARPAPWDTAFYQTRGTT
jgi:hypothetical protein